jgi:hypothetical protein
MSELFANDFDFSADTDLFDVADDIVKLVLADSSDQPRSIGIRGFLRAMSRADVASSNGAFTLADIWWNLSSDDCAVDPAANDHILEVDGTKWKILTAPYLQTGHSRWKCASRRL